MYEPSGRRWRRCPRSTRASFSNGDPVRLIAESSLRSTLYKNLKDIQLFYEGVKFESYSQVSCSHYFLYIAKTKAGIQSSVVTDKTSKMSTPVAQSDYSKPTTLDEDQIRSPRRTDHINPALTVGRDSGVASNVSDIGKMCSSSGRGRHLGLRSSTFVSSPSQSSEIDRPNFHVWPKFSEQSPNTFFTLLEIMFQRYHIISQTERFELLCSCVDGGYLARVNSDVVLATTNQPYDSLRSALITEFTPSRNQKLDILLHSYTPSDSLPSVILRELKFLIGNDSLHQTFASEILRKKFMDMLPMNTRAVLATKPDSSLDELAKIADKIHMDLGRAESTTANGSSQQQLLESKLMELSDKLEGLSTQMDRLYRNNRNESGYSNRGRRFPSNNWQRRPPRSSSYGQHRYNSFGSHNANFTHGHSNNSSPSPRYENDKFHRPSSRSDIHSLNNSSGQNSNPRGWNSHPRVHNKPQTPRPLN